MCFHRLSVRHVSHWCHCPPRCELQSRDTMLIWLITLSLNLEMRKYPHSHPASDILEPAFFVPDLWPWTHLKFLLWQLLRQDLVGHLQGFIHSLTLQAEWLVFPLWVEKSSQGSPFWDLENTGLPVCLRMWAFPIMDSLTLILLTFLWEIINVKLSNYNWIMHNQMTVCSIYI